MTFADRGGKMDSKNQIKNFSDIVTWSVEELVMAASSNSPKKNTVFIPKYQRNLVWKEEARRDFIDSVKSGYPIGSLLLYKMGEDSGIAKYNLIDGLQRTSTLLEYTKKPTKFFSESDIDEELVEKILDALSISDQADRDRTRQELISAIIEWVKNLEGFKESNGFSSFNLAMEINTQLGLKLDVASLKTLTASLVSFIEKLEEESNISQARVPIIIYYGQISQLPDIFERLNSKGTKLNKYQVYAATWEKYGAFKIKDINVKEQIKQKYDALVLEDLIVEDYDPNPNTFYASEFTMFEFIFGLGKLLTKQYPELFGPSGKEGEIEAIGFNLCTVCLGIDLKDKGDQVPQKLGEVFALFDGQDKFITAIRDVAYLVSQELKPFIGLKANKKKSGPTKFPIYHTELQIVSLIGKVFVSKYDIQTLDENPSWKTHKKKLLRNIQHYYLFDILREYWRGSGDAKANESARPISRYDDEITPASWNNILDEWFKAQLQRRETARTTPKDTEILFLKYIYTHLLSVYQDVGSIEFDIEHLVPVEPLKKLAGQTQGLPISCVANFCLMAKELNQSKSNMTVYNYFDQEVQAGAITRQQADEAIAEIEKFTFTQRSDLEFTGNNLIRDRYVEFLQKRFEVLKKEFLIKNGIIPK